MLQIRSVAIACLVTLALSISILTFIPSEVEALNDEVTVSIDQDELSASVGPDDDGIVEFTGSFTVESTNRLVVADVHLEGRADDWIAYFPDGCCFKVPVDESGAEWRCLVEVPLGTTSDQVRTLTITAQVTTGSTIKEEGSDTATITVEEFYGVDATSSGQVTKLYRNDEQVLEVTVENTGNCQGIYMVELLGYSSNDLDYAGVSYQLSQTQVNIAAGETSTVSITLGTGSTITTPERMTVDVKIYTNQGEYPMEVTESLTVDLLDEDKGGSSTGGGGTGGDGGATDGGSTGGSGNTGGGGTTDGGAEETNNSPGFAIVLLVAAVGLGGFVLSKRKNSK